MTRWESCWAKGRNGLGPPTLGNLSTAQACPGAGRSQ